jgi:hypothetical protein
MNEHTGFELNLSDYEKGYLTAFFDHVVLPDWSGDDSQDWYGVGTVVGTDKPVFDLNVWVDEDTSQIVCVVYRCVEKDGEWTTDMSASWFLREASNVS